MDETAVYMSEGSQSTINQKGASSIYIPSTGYESARVACILTICLDGSKVSLLVITKSKMDTIERICVLQTEKARSRQAIISK